MPDDRPIHSPRLAEIIIPGAAVVLVLGLLAFITVTSVGEWGRAPADYNYNLLVRALQAGRLDLPKAVPPGLTQLKDPFDPDANLVYRLAPYSLHDLSYFRGRLYLYFGITPALILLWPWVALTGHYLPHKYAAEIFSGIGFLAATGLLRSIRRRYFSEVSVGVFTAAVFALGLASGLPILLQRADVCEVPISCAFAMAMLALGAVWRELHDPARRGRWLAAASVAYGLAIGARPSVLFGSAILLIPVFYSLKGSGPNISTYESAAKSKRPDYPRIFRLLALAILPIALCGTGLLIYNYLRFQNPFEFGEHYQLAGDRQDSARHFSLSYLWFDFRVYFLSPMRWSTYFPFVRPMSPPVPPPGHVVIEEPFGILPGIPFVLAAFAAPLTWLRRDETARARLRWIVAGTAILFVTSAFVMDLFYGNCSRYEIEFLPALALLAAIGILGLERALAGNRVWQLGARCVWMPVLAYSIAFNLLECAEHHAVERYTLGSWLREAGRNDEAIAELKKAVAVEPDYVEAYDNLGGAQLQVGQVGEAVDDFRRALKFNPGSAQIHSNLGNALMAGGERAEAIAEYGEAVRLDPSSFALQYNLGNALLKAGRVREAVQPLQDAVRLSPGYPSVHSALGAALAQAGRLPEAEVEFREALRLNPNLAEVHFNLSILLSQMGRRAEADLQYREALRLRPDLGRPRP